MHTSGIVAAQTSHDFDPPAPVSTARAAAALTRVSLALSAVAFAGFGLLLFVSPDTLQLVGVSSTRAAGDVELRAFYGGLELGIAAFFVLALGRRSWHVPALVVQVLTLGGAALGRALAIAFGGGAEPWILALMTAETLGAALGTLALLRSRSPRP